MLRCSSNQKIIDYIALWLDFSNRDHLYKYYPKSIQAKGAKRSSPKLSFFPLRFSTYMHIRNVAARCHMCTGPKSMRNVACARNVDRGTFMITPLVFTTASGAGPAANVSLADEVAENKNARYAQTFGWLRNRISFARLRSSILRLCGSRSHRKAAPSTLPSRPRHC